jgi:hypothetical protein
VTLDAQLVADVTKTTAVLFPFWPSVFGGLVVAPPPAVVVCSAVMSK